MATNKLMSIFRRQDAVAASPPVDNVAAVTPRRTLNPLIPICCVGLILFLIAVAIVLSLIPVYLTARDVDRRIGTSTQFTLSYLLRNGYLPVGSLSTENCAAIQNQLRQRALTSNQVKPSVPTVASCTVTGTASTTTTGKRKKRQAGAEGNLVAVVVILSAGNCITDRCSFSRANAFIKLLLGLGDFTLNLGRSDGSRFDFIGAFISSSIVTTPSAATTPSTATTPPSSTNPSLVFYALTLDNQLALIDVRNPATANLTMPITGLKANDTIYNIDFRPASGELYGVADRQLYAINSVTGVARPIGDPINSTLGIIYTMEFDAVYDVLFCVTDLGNALIINPETNEVIDQLAPNTTSAVSVASSHNLAGATASLLYFIDAETDFLYSKNITDNSSMAKVGSGLGINITDTCGFDIAYNGLALACVFIDNTSVLYLVDLNNGTLSQNLGVTSSLYSGMAIPVFGVAYGIISSNNSLLFINLFEEGLVFNSKNITGLQDNETILAIDMRPYNSRMYALGSTSRLYIIDLGPGGAYESGNGSTFTPLLNGTAFGMDFNPTNDLIRVVSNTGQNLRINPDTGNVIGVDGQLNPDAPNITAIAYSNNVPNATNTVLYDLDSGFNRLYMQNTPNNGTLIQIAPLNIDFDDFNGFDIGAQSGNGYAALTVNGVTSIYIINTTTGEIFTTPAVTLPVALRGITFTQNT